MYLILTTLSISRKIQTAVGCSIVHGDNHFDELDYLDVNNDLILKNIAHDIGRAKIFFKKYVCYDVISG
jgi:hypothetical protein